MDLQQAQALFNAQYLYQPVLRFLDRPGESFKLSPYDCREIPRGYLLLKSVSDLTDEELTICIHLSKEVMTGHFEPEFNDVPMGKWIVQNYQFIHDRIGQYLRLKNVLIPFTYLDESGTPITLQPEEIVKMGWAKLQTKES